MWFNLTPKKIATLFHHNYFSDFLITESLPNLSRNRTFNAENSGALSKHELHSGERRRVVHKTVQAWLNDVEWPRISEQYVGTKYSKVIFPILQKLNKKISLATQFHTDK